MKKYNLLNWGNKLFVGFSIFSLASVSLLSMYSPQATMDLVHVQLTNTDALSSIRGVYGGVGLVIVISLIYLLINKVELAVRFLALFWGFYALSRLVTILVDGALGDFGNQWIIIEFTLFLVGGLLIVLGERLRWNVRNF